VSLSPLPSSNSEDTAKEVQQQKESEVKVVPVLAEKYSISKKIIVEDFTIERRWVTGTAKIEVSVKHKEIYVNGKKLGSKNGIESILTPNLC
jgi:stress response protein YsnF